MDIIQVSDFYTPIIRGFMSEQASKLPSDMAIDKLREKIAGSAFPEPIKMAFLQDLDDATPAALTNLQAALAKGAKS